MFNDRSSGLLGMTADPGLVSLLASMEPKQRQHYVAQHSNDINVVIMGKVVSDIANKLEIAKKGAQPGTNSTVLAQTIASMAPEPQVRPQGQQQVMPLQGETQMAANGGYMDSRLPEDMGIGALPERSLSNMADGGIVGFADGGDTQRFQSGGTPKPRPMYPGMIGQEGEGLLPNTTGYEGMSILEFIQKFGVDAYNKIKNAIPGESTEARLARQKREVYDATPSGQRDKAMAEVNASAPVDPMSLPPRKLGPYSQTGVLPDQAGGGGAKDSYGAGPPRPNAAAPRPAAAAAAAARPTVGAPPAANAAATGIQTLVTKDLTPEDIADARKKFTEKQPAVVDTLKDQRQALVDEKNKNAEAEFTGFKERMAKQGDPYAKQEERANKQEASIAESAERSPHLALMEAGFAMMAGDSPYAMVNIGKGALAGTKTYREGLALLEKAKEKLNETRDRIDGLRLIRSDLNDKEERDIQRETRRTALEGKTIMFDALEKLTGESKVQVENNVKMFMEAETARRLAGRNAELERYRQGEETTRAKLNASSQAGIAATNRAMQEKIAGMPSKEAQMAVSLGTGDTYEARLESGLRKVQEIIENPKIILQEYSKHVKESADAVPPREPMTAEAFAERSRALIAAMKNTGAPNTDFKLKGSSPAN